jgi:aminopeptidase N
LLTANTIFAYTHADTLRGSNGNGRNWWDVQKYALNISFDTATKSISGSCAISFKITTATHDSMQIDLQEPMAIDSVYITDPNYKHYKNITIAREGNVYWLKYHFNEFAAGSEAVLWVYYHGSPRKAINPPWDGGFSWTHDKSGKPWIAVSCQGLGASVWWPCKDCQWDEPDYGMEMNFAVSTGLTCVSNGRLVSRGKNTSTNKTEWQWEVKNPINNYDVTFYIGDYLHWHDTIVGEKGPLDLDFWVLRENYAKAQKQFKVVKPMLHCYEHWMGSYPFYEDGYKLVDAPYLGMEHQSAVAYGNKYEMGYLGTDRSGTGVGMNFDYIVVHESGHEWFGNNITAKDIADNWIHESFTTYTETLFAECLLDKEQAGKYCRGEWKNIVNDKPVIGEYGVNDEGSNDMYDKGTAILYMIRKIVNDDEKFRQTLRGLNSTFYHQTVTTRQVEDYMSKSLGIDLSPFFNQYLRTADIPEFEYYIKDNELYYKFNNTVDNFTLPIEIIAGKKSVTVKPIKEWQHMSWKNGYNIRITDDFLVTLKT